MQIFVAVFPLAHATPSNSVGLSLIRQLLKCLETYRSAPGYFLVSPPGIETSQSVNIQRSREEGRPLWKFRVNWQNISRRIAKTIRVRLLLRSFLSRVRIRCIENLLVENIEMKNLHLTSNPKNGRTLRALQHYRITTMIYLNVTNVITGMYLLTSYLFKKKYLIRKQIWDWKNVKMYSLLLAFLCDIRKREISHESTRIFDRPEFDWNVEIRCRDVTALVRREVWGLYIPGDVVSRCRTRGMSREIHCDEYLRLRLRKSKAIRFNRRERRYETRESRIDFPCPLRAAFSLEICWLFGRRVTFFVLHRAAIRYLAPERRKTEIYYFPSATTCYLCPAVWFLGIFKVAARGLSRRYAAPLLFSCNVARQENLCAANDDSARVLVLVTRFPHKPSIFQRFDSAPLPRTSPEFVDSPT